MLEYLTLSEKMLVYIAVHITLGVWLGLFLKFYQLFVQTNKRKVYK
jgi:hypothetical protein